MTYAGFWKRFAAIMLDTFLIYFISFVIGLVVTFIIASGGGLSSTDMESTLAQLSTGWAAQIGSIVVLWLYFAGFESSPKQATPGKMALRIKVTDLDGQRLSFGRATGRHFGKFLCLITLFIGYLMVFFTEKEQGLHDLVAKCLVVNKTPSQAQHPEQRQHETILTPEV